MSIGVMFDIDQPIDDVVAQVASMASAGIETAWASQIFGYDALTAAGGGRSRSPRHRVWGPRWCRPIPGIR